MIKADKLINYFRQAKADGWGYIYGESGDVWTQYKQDRTTDQMAISYGQKWVGKRVADCSGLFSGGFSKLGGYIPHGSNTIYRKYTTATGTDMSKAVPGYAVFKRRPGTKYADKIDWYHIGLYIGDGIAIEAKGTPYGVVQSKLSEWHAWGAIKGVDYNTATEETDMQGKAVVKTPNNGTVNLRRGKSTLGTKAGTLREGETVEILEDDGTWCKVTYECYIMSQFLREVS